MIISAQNQALRMPGLASPDSQIGSAPSEALEASFQDVFQKTNDEIQKNLQSRMAAAAGILKGTRKSGAPEKTGSANTRQEPCQEKTAPALGHDTLSGTAPNVAATDAAIISGAPPGNAAPVAEAPGAASPGNALSIGTAPNNAAPGVSAAPGIMPAGSQESGGEASPGSSAVTGRLSFEACGIISGEYIIASEALPESITPASAKAPPGEKEREAQEKEKEQQDKLRAEEIYTRMKAERELHFAKMQAILAELQTEIRRIWNEVMLRRQKVHDDMLKNWHKVFIG